MNSRKSLIEIDNNNSLSVFRDDMIHRIEQFITNLLRDFLNHGPSTQIQLSKHLSWLNTYCDIDKVLHLKQTSLSTSSNNSVIEKIQYRRVSSRQRFALLVYILHEVQELLLLRNYCTCRELYYRNVDLSGGSQRKVERAVHDICNLLQTTTWNLGIFSAAKGHIAGYLSIHMSNGDVIDCYNFKSPTTIPPNFTYIDFFETTAEYILLIEKDTIFEKLLSINIFSIINKHIILVTARGYPDIVTRFVLQRLCREHNLPIYMLADADPCGIEIMLIYRHGSLAQATNSLHLACPNLKWLGIHPSDIALLNLPTEKLTLYDNKKIHSLLLRNYLSEGVRCELKILKRNRFKAKLETMSKYSFRIFVEDYIINKIKRQVFI